jgi:hypothetical protein
MLWGGVDARPEMEMRMELELMCILRLMMNNIMCVYAALLGFWLS